MSTGLSEIEFESSGMGFNGIVATGGTEIEFTTYGVTGINFITEIELEQSGSGFAGRVASGESTIDISSSGISFGTSIGTGQSDIEIETDGSGSFTIVGTGKSTLNIVSDGSGINGIIGVGSSEIEISTSGDGTLTAITITGTGRCNIEIDSISNTADAGIVGTGISSIELEIDSTGLGGIVGTGLSSILFTSKCLATIVFVATDYTCVVINTKTGAVSEYDNYDFNSFCELPTGEYLGFRSDGIYELDGEDDDGTDIDAYVTWGFLDPNIPTASRLDMGYLVGESTGDIKVTTICDEDQSCEDILQHLMYRRDHPVRIARGFKGRLYEVKIENVDGAGFTMSSYRILARELKKQR